jgi:hypothetical protein
MGISNYLASNTNGTHWVCWFTEKALNGSDTTERFEGSRVCYIDSFGLEPPTKMVAFLKGKDKEVVMSDGNLQDIKSVLCGFYCLYFIIHHSKGEKIEDMLARFYPDNTMKNEKIIREFFNLVD